MGNLRQLVTLDLQNNRLAELPENIARLKSLRMLSLNNNQLKTVPVGAMAKLKNLEYLNLEDNPLAAPKETLGELKKLLPGCLVLINQNK